MGLFDRFMGRSRGVGIELAAQTGRAQTPATSPSSEQHPDWMTDGVRVTLAEGNDDLEVVGESFYQDNLWGLVGGRTGKRVRREGVTAVQVAEHDNRYDANAISVWVDGFKVSHLSRDDAVRLRPGLLGLQQKHGKAIALSVVITGSGADEGRTGTLGVFLDYDPAEFGLNPVPFRATSGPIRTGTSHAMATDAADDTYDLGWIRSLSGDPRKRIAQLRDLLGHETDLISRHYVFAELESTLYRFREAFTTALEEYDAACDRHDSEMDVIRPALVEKFSVVPQLDTYRQAAIRHQKVKDFVKALRLAERGIALYGGLPANQEVLLDLHKRAATYRAKLSRSRPATVRTTVTDIGEGTFYEDPDLPDADPRWRSLDERYNPRV